MLTTRFVLLLLLLPVLLAGCGATGSDPRIAVLEQRVQQLEDQEEIRQVLIAYGEYFDARDYAGYVSLFAREGVWTGGFGTFTGRAAIQAMLEEKVGKAEPGFINKSSFHLMTTMAVQVSGDTATARSRYTFITASKDNKPGMALAGRYVDEFVREDGKWKIKHRITHGVIPWRDGNAPPPPPAAAPVK